jgi:hypothetical protein
LKEGRRIEVMGRSGRRRKQLVNDIKERENIGNLRRNTRAHCVENCCGRGERIVVRETMEWMNDTYI